MTTTRVIGIVLIVLGLAALAYRGFGFTKRDKVIDMGAIEVTRNDHEFVAIPPLASGLAVVAGAVLAVAGGRR